MKCVILAAGEGIRMRPLTIDRPKPMIQVCGKPLLHHIFDALPDKITGVILVVGYKGDAIKKYFGNSFQGKKIKYIWQKEKKGTAHALLLCRRYLKNGKFLMLYADDIHNKDSLNKLIKHRLALLVSKAKHPERFGVILTDGNGKIIDIEEKPQKPKSNLVSTGAKVLDRRIFNYKPVRHPNGEYYLTTMLDELIRDHKVMAQKASFWFPIGYPEDIKKAEKILFSKNIKK